MKKTRRRHPRASVCMLASRPLVLYAAKREEKMKRGRNSSELAEKKKDGGEMKEMLQSDGAADDE